MTTITVLICTIVPVLLALGWKLSRIFSRLVALLRAANASRYVLTVERDVVKNRLLKIGLDLRYDEPSSRDLPEA